MKNDIDFDELDKAVNSLMGGVPGSEDDAEPQKTLTISTTLQPGEDPEYEKLKEVAKGIGDETFVIDSDPDIVKDLGEIASPNAPTTPNESLRAAQSITIPSTPAKTPITSSTPVESAAPETPVTPVARRPAGGRFMDVVHPSSDMRTATSSKDTASTSSATPSASGTEPANKPVSPAASRPTPTPAPQQPDAATPPLTPFLPDAKVEKRPLGDPLASPVTVAVSEQPQPDTSANAAIEDVPEEIVAINSEAKARSAIDTDDQSVLDAAAIITEENNAEAEQLSGIEAEEVAATGSSIQQVESVAAEHEAVSTPAGANMYDVQPLGHPAKRRSGWGVVLIIVIIILVAGAIGAGAYFYFDLGA